MSQKPFVSRLKSLASRVEDLEKRVANPEKQDDELIKMIAEAEAKGKIQLARFNERFGHHLNNNSEGKSSGKDTISS
ncbi:MAG: hypothetical protein ACMZ64_07625 [Oleiphilus sp.]